MPIPKLYTYDGRTMTLREWSRETGITKGTLVSRLLLPDWTIERALTTPVREGKRPTKPRPFHHKNLLLIDRIGKATARARAQHQTGGQSRTSPNPSRTGVCPSKTDFEGARP